MLVNGNSGGQDDYNVNPKLKFNPKNSVDTDYTYKSLYVEAKRFEDKSGDVSRDQDGHADGLVDEKDVDLYNKMITKLTTFYNTLSNYVKKKEGDHAFEVLDKKSYRNMLNWAEGAIRRFTITRNNIVKGGLEFNSAQFEKVQGFSAAESAAAEEYNEFLNSTNLYNKDCVLELKNKFDGQLNEMKAEYENAKRSGATRYATELQNVITKFEATINKLNSRAELCESYPSDSYEPDVSDANVGTIDKARTNANNIVQNSGFTELTGLLNNLLKENDPEKMKASFNSIRSNINELTLKLNGSINNLKQILKADLIQEEKEIYNNALNMLKNLADNLNSTVELLTYDERQNAENERLERVKWNTLSTGLRIDTEHGTSDEKLTQKSLQLFADKWLGGNTEITSYEQIKNIPYKADVMLAIVNLLAKHDGLTSARNKNYNSGNDEGILRSDQVDYLRTLYNTLEQAFHEEGEDLKNRFEEINKKSEQARLDAYAESLKKIQKDTANMREQWAEYCATGNPEALSPQ